MNSHEYKVTVGDLPFGKKLPGAVYLHWDGSAAIGESIEKLITTLKARYDIGKDFNVLKFRTEELKVSLLSYPEFFTEAHPALRHAVTIDLVTGKARHTDYSKNLNPPILHRKETFLPAAHPRREEFAELTRAEETAGLYTDTTTIGFKLNWEKLLKDKGLVIEGHRLRTVDSAPVDGATEDGGRRTVDSASGCGVAVQRHRTAMTRYELSKPVKTLLEYGMLRAGSMFFDYGCGQGSDVSGLTALGHVAEGWDPVHRPGVAKQQADVVNLGYVLNVIEDPAERVETLVDAFRHTKRLLVVAGLINETVDTSKAQRFADGVLTKFNTFQKYFEQQELQQYIEDALETTAVPVALGIFYVFRDPADQQDFLAARSRRLIDWGQITARLGLGGPRTLWKALYEEHKELLDGFGKLALTLQRIPTEGEFDRLGEIAERIGSAKRALRAFVQGGGAADVAWDEIKARFGIGAGGRRRWEILCDEHRELLEEFWRMALELGRTLEPGEFSRYGELRERVGSGKKALKLLVLSGGGEELRRAAEARKRDLLVYVALANLRKKVPFGHLSQTLRYDIREFFGNYTRALKEGVELLYAAGDPGEIELACEGLQLGWQDEQALFIHRSLLNDLPPVLRAYVGCATALFGDVAQADVIKLHKVSGKVTFLVYDDFEGKSLPELRQRIKVNLRTRWVQVFDHSAEGQLLYFKERFLAADHPGRGDMEKFSTRPRKLGIQDAGTGGPLKAVFSVAEPS